MFLFPPTCAEFRFERRRKGLEEADRESRSTQLNPHTFDAKPRQDFDSTGGSSSAGVSPSNGGSEGGGGGGSKGFKKRAWVTSEDNLLKQLVETHGPKDWNFISAQLTGRSAKQCCERCVRL